VGKTGHGGGPGDRPGFGLAIPVKTAEPARWC
jgi:hypothetical protein